MSDPIKSALAWLDENEPKWGLDEPINRDEFVADLKRRMQPQERKKPARLGGNDITIGLQGAEAGGQQAEMA